MGKHAARHSITALTLFVAVACGGRSLVEREGSAGASSSAAGAPSAGAASSAAGAQSSSAGGAAAGSSECDYDEDCILIGKGCCGPSEPVDASQLLSLNGVDEGNYESIHCPTPPPCFASLSGNELTDTKKYYRAVCSHDVGGPTGQGRCDILDVRGTRYTSCTTSDECVLRDGVNCCPECGEPDWVPVNNSVDFCDRGGQCARCDPDYPTGFAAGCQAGTCRFVPPAH